MYNLKTATKGEKSTYSILTLLLVSQGQASMWKQKLGLRVLGKQTKQADMSVRYDLCSIRKQKKVPHDGPRHHNLLCTCHQWALYRFRQEVDGVCHTVDSRHSGHVGGRSHPLGFGPRIKCRKVHCCRDTANAKNKRAPDMPRVQIRTAQITSVNC